MGRAQSVKACVEVHVLLAAAAAFQTKNTNQQPQTHRKDRQRKILDGGDDRKEWKLLATMLPELRNNSSLKNFAR